MATKSKSGNDAERLLLAALKGDWEDAKEFFKPDKGKKYFELGLLNGMNALHVAAANGQTGFVEKIVKVLTDRPQIQAPKYLALPMSNRPGFTALHLAAMGGHLEMAKALIKAGNYPDHHLTGLKDSSTDTPLLCALKNFSGYKLVRYLALKTHDEVPGLPFTPSKAGDLMVYITHMGFHDISLYLIRRELPKVQGAEQSWELEQAKRKQRLLVLAKSTERDETILKALASEPANFYSGTKLYFWQRWVYQLIPVHEMDLELKDSPTDCCGSVYQWAQGVLVRGTMKILGINTIREKKLRHERACKLVDHYFQALREYRESCESCEKKVLDDYFKELQQILRIAVRHGIVEIVTRSLHYFPRLIFSEFGKWMLKDAIKCRQEKIFNLACKSTALDKLLATRCTVKDPEDASNSDVNEVLSPSHLLAMPPAFSRLSNNFAAASQMQREMQWYKEVECIQHPGTRELTSEINGETAFDIFSKNRKEMRENAEKWMKDTSGSGMVVATLIATMAFAAAFTLPGGNNDEGNPIFLHETSFKVFIFSVALALFSSVNSIIMFLSILTSSYKEEDFLRSLPQRMIIGLASLFSALAAIMVSFASGLAIILTDRFKWVLGPIIAVPLVPASLFIVLQLPLFIDMVESTYGPCFRREEIWKRDNPTGISPE